MKNLLVLFAVVLLAGCGREEKLADLYDETVVKTVSVYVASQQEGVPPIISGSGVFVSDDGDVLTAAHLFFPEAITGITVCNYTGICTAGVLRHVEGRNDLALVETMFEVAPYARIADPRELRVGQQLLAIGNPMGLEFSASHGIISALNRDAGGLYNASQSDVMINPGNSGGPLFNLAGEVVGINSRILSVAPPINTGVSFSVAAGQLREFLIRARKKK